MITPSFVLDQTETHILITVSVPLLRAQNIEFTIDAFMFHCLAKPYYLRLSFPRRIVQDGTETYKLDLLKGILYFSVPKANPGEKFPDLDLPEVFLKKPSSEILNPSSSSLVLEVEDELGGIDNAEANIFQEDEYEDTYVDQKECVSPLISHGYGFNFMYNDLFKNFPKEATLELFDIEYPEITSLQSRKALQYEQELRSFDEDAYIYDFVDEEKNIAEALAFPAPEISDSDIEFSEDENKALVALGTKSYDLKPVYYGVIDILLAYLYNRRIFQGEWVCETAWLVSKLAATISHLQAFKSLNSVVSSFVRRSLCFPLFRHYELSLEVIKDTSKALSKGKKKFLLKIFLEIKTQFDRDEVRYPISKIFLNDYCIWLQGSSEKSWAEISKRLESISIPKDALPWPLIQYELLVQEANDL